MEISGVSSGSEFVSGSSLSLTCTIQRQGGDYVDTPTTVMSSWDAPNTAYDRDNEANASSVDLDIDSLETADSGDYMCSADVVDSSGSEYVVNSTTATDTISIVVSKYMYMHIVILIVGCSMYYCVIIRSGIRNSHFIDTYNVYYKYEAQ